MFERLLSVTILIPSNENLTIRAKQCIAPVDIDECTVKNGGCSHDCTNTVGSYECSCPDVELSLADDKHTCEGKMKIKKKIVIIVKH